MNSLHTALQSWQVSRALWALGGLLILFAQPLVGQDDSGIRILNATQHHHSGCRQGIAHTHPNGICGPNRTEFRAEIQVTSSGVQSIDSLVFDWCKLGIVKHTKRLLKTGETYVVSNGPNADFQIEWGAILPPVPPGKSVTNQIHLEFTQNGIRKMFQVDYQITQDIPIPSANFKYQKSNQVID